MTACAAPRHGDKMRPCARGEWCLARTVTTEDGQRTVHPKLTPDPFCSPDRDRIAECLGELPAQYVWLQAELGELTRRAQMIRVPFGPALPLREDIDALMRLMAHVLRGWEARTRAARQLAPPDTALPVDSPGSVAESVKALAIHIGDLLALQDGWMSRSFPLHPGRHGQPASITQALLNLHGDSEIVRVGADSITVMTELGGTDAGLDILRLHRQARVVLGDTQPKPEELLGVPCRNCDTLALRRTAAAGYWSVCRVCGDRLTEPHYRAWVKLCARYEQERMLTPALE